MRFRCIVLLICASWPMVSRAEEVCPWLNAATAGGLLGGEVSSSVTHAGNDKGDGTCQYTFRSGKVAYVMYIEVATMGNVHNEFARYLARCSSNRTSLRAIGNEAVTCTHQERNGQESEQIVSRVRDRALVVRIAATDPSAKSFTIREKVRSAAEQVAGNLF
jgi:hypothetical protein